MSNWENGYVWVGVDLSEVGELRVVVVVIVVLG